MRAEDDCHEGILFEFWLWVAPRQSLHPHPLSAVEQNAVDDSIRIEPASLTIIRGLEKDWESRFRL